MATSGVLCARCRLVATRRKSVLLAHQLRPLAVTVNWRRVVFMAILWWAVSSETFWAGIR